MLQTTSSRRTFLRSAGMLTGGALLIRYSPWLERPAVAQAQNLADQARAQLGAVPIQTTVLGERLVLLSGPGGNVVVLHGPDGKVLTDTFVQPAWSKLKATLDGLDKSAPTAVIDTHWHFDHADNNASLRGAGAKIVAHANTRKRLMQRHDIIGMHFEPAPADALPTETFTDKHSLTANGERTAMMSVPPAHTDTDILVHFTRNNVLHMGDLFFNGMYPFIDASTGGKIDGMTDAAGRALKIVDERTKIVPGHGPLGDKAMLEKYHVMLSTIRDRVRARKAKGETVEQVQAARPTADFDAVWGKGVLAPDAFVALVYNTL